MNQIPVYQHEFEITYGLMVGGRNRAFFDRGLSAKGVYGTDDLFVPAVEGLNELEATVQKLKEGVKRVEGVHTKVTIVMDNSDLFLKVQTNEDAIKILRRFVDEAGLPYRLYGSADMIDSMERTLNDSYNSTTYRSRTIKPSSIGHRMEKWLTEREERK
ncbi:MAG: hypothetical protein AABX32_04615, partial [Nanoarchaeota archaeon]